VHLHQAACQILVASAFQSRGRVHLGPFERVGNTDNARVKTDMQVTHRFTPCARNGAEEGLGVA
jgi:hypothetical protein